MSKPNVRITFDCSLLRDEARQGMGSPGKLNVAGSSKRSVLEIRPRGWGCPYCYAPLRRLSIEDVGAGQDRVWIRRFADAASGLSPGRYRCEECLSEWWQFPAVAAS
jgi:hypothetical protein